MLRAYAHLVSAALDTSPRWFLLLTYSLPLAATGLICFALLNNLPQNFLLNLGLLFGVTLLWPAPSAVLVIRLVDRSVGGRMCSRP
jgi:hypothetical protein